MDVSSDLIRSQVSTALAEDLGEGDKTAGLIPEQHRGEAEVICREHAVLCGRSWFDEVFRQLDPEVEVEWKASEATRLVPGQIVCQLSGSARVLLSGERTALNFLQMLSGTATITSTYVTAAANPGVRILDTRKTIPGFRMAQKYAVRCGGGHNHRFGLFDAILIKENHIEAAGSLTAALEAAQKQHPDVEIEVEVEDIKQLQEALWAGARRVLLDNFDIAQLEQAVELSAGRLRLEASGGVDLDTIAKIAATGVDDISVGALTKDVRAVDYSMRFIDGPER